ncbi:U-box domain-containing protein 62 [Populus alba]|uniref:U-box domain-containing protein 62 n=1 Tax=Populus alba TaxID=43335 RepID=UPI003CC7357F
MVKDGIGGGGGLGQTGNNAVTIAEADGEMYYSQYLQGTGGSVLVERIWVWKMAVDFLEGRRFQHFSSESGDSLRAILSAPVTGALMDDAMILPCGHSFGAGGMQHVIRMLSDMLSRHFSGRRGVYNLSLIQKGSERGLTRTKVVMAIQGSWIHSQGRGVQFPFAVTDRGNKRTPPAVLFGREAVCDTQLLKWMLG